MYKIILTLLITLLSTSLFADDKQYTISGYVKDSLSGESLIGAVISINGGKSVPTNTYGFYSIITSNSKVNLTVSYLGYTNKNFKITLSSDLVKDIFLYQRVLNLDEVTVLSDRYDALTFVKNYGSVAINADQLKYVPLFMGEKDLFKFFQLQPGVSPGKEGSSGMNLRGGSSDQTLILLDDIPIYNHSHAFGFVSIFSGDFIKSAELYKGYVPSHYGGRLSGVVTMNMREGNRNKHKQSIQIGMMTASASLEGPINNGKGSYLVGGRYFMPNLALSLFSPKDDKYNIGFYDITAKVSHDLGKNNTLYASFYTGKDLIGFSSEQNNNEHDQEGNIIDSYTTDDSNSVNWGNIVGSVRLSSQINNKLFLNTTAYYSFLFNENSYNYEDSRSEYGTYSSTKSQLGELGIKMLLEQNIDQNYNISYGINMTSQNFVPMSISYDRGGVLVENDYQKMNLLSGGMFIDNKFKFDKFEVNIGARAAMFNNGTESKLVVEPRLSTSYKMANSSIWLSYVENNQPLFSMTQYHQSLPVDYWIPFQRGSELPHSNQVSLGYKHTFSSGIELFAETYVKQSRNISLIYNSDDFLLDEGGYNLAKGMAYGAEFMVQYQKGRFNFLGSYTYSKSEYDIDGRKVDFMYDTPHNLNMLGAYKTLISEKRNHTLSININYKSGLPYMLTNDIYPSYDSWHEWASIITSNPMYANKRLNNFFRLDVNYSMEKKLKKGSRIWQISLLNATAHKNPYMVFNTSDNKYKAFYLIPILPSFSYTRKF